MFVKPRTPETVVRDPKSRVKLPPEGKNVPETSYWVRRLQAGDVVRATPAKAAKVSTPKPAKPKKNKAKAAKSSDIVASTNKDK